MPKILSAKNLKLALKTLHDDWKVDDTETRLSRTVIAASYIRGFMLVTKVAIHAEVLQHYPTVTLSKTRVKIVLTTPTAKGITEIDIKLAKAIDQLLLSTERR